MTSVYDRGFRAEMQALKKARNWLDDAACRGMDTEVFFPQVGNNFNSPAMNQLVDNAKQICAGCPVREPCVEYALNNREPYGIFGGMTTDERRILARRLGRPLPPSISGPSRSPRI